jgi:hypothetical protein
MKWFVASQLMRDGNLNFVADLSCLSCLLPLVVLRHDADPPKRGSAESDGDHTAQFLQDRATNIDAWQSAYSNTFAQAFKSF